MRASRKVFWINLIAGVVSIIAICISVHLYHCYGCEIFDIIKNIFISLVGGTFLSATLALNEFYNIRKKYIIKFNSEYIKLSNIIFYMANWFNWRYDRVNYQIQKSPELDKINDNMVKEFVELEDNLYNYDYDLVFEIIDDFCGLSTQNKNLLLRNKMKEMLNFINNFNVIYLKEENQAYTLYKQGIYDEYLYFENIIKPFHNKVSNEEVKKLKTLQAEYLSLSKINKYLKKINQSRKEPIE